MQTPFSTSSFILYSLPSPLPYPSLTLSPTLSLVLLFPPCPLSSPLPTLSFLVPYPLPYLNLLSLFPFPLTSPIPILSFPVTYPLLSPPSIFSYSIPSPYPLHYLLLKKGVCTRTKKARWISRCIYNSGHLLHI